MILSEQGTGGKPNLALQKLSELGIQLDKISDLNVVLDYLNLLSQRFALLYIGYQDQLVLPEDRLLNNQMRAKYLLERDYDELSFTNYVLMSVQEQKKKFEDISAIENLSDEKRSKDQVNLNKQ